MLKRFQDSSQIKTREVPFHHVLELLVCCSHSAELEVFFLLNVRLSLSGSGQKNFESGLFISQNLKERPKLR